MPAPSSAPRAIENSFSFIYLVRCRKLISIDFLEGLDFSLHRQRHRYQLLLCVDSDCSVRLGLVLEDTRFE